MNRAYYFPRRSAREFRTRRGLGVLDWLVRPSSIVEDSIAVGRLAQTFRESGSIGDDPPTMHGRNRWLVTPRDARHRVLRPFDGPRDLTDVVWAIDVLSR